MRLADDLRRDGIHVDDAFLDDATWRALGAVCARRELAPAAVGHARHHDAALRGDRTAWLDADDPLLARLDATRRALNEALLLNLAEVEAHFACYAPGTRYARHRDAFRDDASRVVSCVLYLNADWRDGDGGALRLYLPDGATRDVAPRGGRAVFFLSADFEHEVLPAKRDRLSIAAWFRRRA